MIRTIQASLSDYFRFIGGSNPCDEWEFNVGNVRCKLVNEWRGGAKLIVNGVIVAHDDKLVAVAVTKPMLSAEVVDDVGAIRTIDVYIRAIFSVKARIDIDGVPTSKGFM